MPAVPAEQMRSRGVATAVPAEQISSRGVVLAVPAEQMRSRGVVPAVPAVPETQPVTLPPTTNGAVAWSVQFPLISNVHLVTSKNSPGYNQLDQAEQVPQSELNNTDVPGDQGHRLEVEPNCDARSRRCLDGQRNRQNSRIMPEAEPNNSAKDMVAKDSKRIELNHVAGDRLSMDQAEQMCN